MAISTHDKVWITSGEASRRLGVSRTSLARLVEQGGISIMRLPGLTATRYKAADIDRVVAKNTIPATVPAGELATAGS